MKKTFIITCFFLAISGIYGQEEKEQYSHFTVSLAYTRMAMLDLQASRNLMDSNGVNANIGYCFRKRNSTIFADVSFFFDGMYPDGNRGNYIFFENYNAAGNTIDKEEMSYQRYCGGLTIGYLYTLSLQPEKKNPFMFEPGFSLSERLDFSTSYQMHGMMNTLDFNLILNITKQLNSRNAISLSLTTPFMAVVSRLPWCSDPSSPDESLFVSFFKKGSRVASYGTYQNFDVNLGYTHIFSNRFAVNCGYRFNWLHYAQPKDITVVYNCFYVGVEL